METKQNICFNCGIETNELHTGSPVYAGDVCDSCNVYVIRTRLQRAYVSSKANLKKENEMTEEEFFAIKQQVKVLAIIFCYNKLKNREVERIRLHLEMN